LQDGACYGSAFQDMPSDKSGPTSRKIASQAEGEGVEFPDAQLCCRSKISGSKNNGLENNAILTPWREVL
jgi:hypothetical protein